MSFLILFYSVLFINVIKAIAIVIRIILQCFKLEKQFWKLRTFFLVKHSILFKHFFRFNEIFVFNVVQKKIFLFPGLSFIDF